MREPGQIIDIRFLNAFCQSERTGKRGRQPVWIVEATGMRVGC